MHFLNLFPSIGDFVVGLLQAEAVTTSKNKKHSSINQLYKAQCLAEQGIIQHSHNSSAYTLLQVAQSPESTKLSGINVYPWHL